MLANSFPLDAPCLVSRNIYHICVPWFFSALNMVTWIDTYSKHPMHSSRFLGAFAFARPKKNVRGWTPEHLRSLGFMWNFWHFTDRKNGSWKTKNMFWFVFFYPAVFCWTISRASLFDSCFFQCFWDSYAGIPNLSGPWHYEWWLMTGHVTRIQDDIPPWGFIMTYNDGSLSNLIHM